MNLKPKCKPSWHELFDKKIVAIYLALALVLLINQVVFTYALKDREKATAAPTPAWGAQIFNTLPGGNVQAGTNNKLVADFWFPDGYSGPVTCNYDLPNPCITLVDADGVGSALAGVDDDGALNFFQAMPPNTKLWNIIVQNPENICTDNWYTPACIYYDPEGNCLNDGTETYALGAGCAAPGDTLVGPGSLFWAHSELVNSNGLWDFCGGPTEPGCSAAAFNGSSTLYWEDAGLCGGTIPADSSWEVDKEPVWDDITADGKYTPGVDTIYWDPGNCLRGTNVCMGGGCVGASFQGGAATIPLFYDTHGGTCGSAISGDNIWQYPEPVWDDIASGDNLFNPPDPAPWNPAMCLPPGAAGIPLISPASATESLWIASHKSDTVLFASTVWNEPFINQWEGDMPGSYWGHGGDETFDDFGGTHVYTGVEAVILDKDDDGVYTDQADILMDADGAYSAGIGTDDDAIADATNLWPIAFTPLANSFCINTFGQGGVNNVIMYIDGSAGADCTPGNGGTDILIRDDTSTGLPGIIAGLGAFPYTFLPGGMFVAFADTINPGLHVWDYCDPAVTPACAAEAATESLWMNGSGLGVYNPNNRQPLEADGTGSLVAINVGPNVDDDAPLLRGDSMLFLEEVDNVCIAFNLAVTAIEDIYIDGTDLFNDAPAVVPNGNGNCIPGDSGVDTLLQDVSADGLNPASVFGGAGVWASAAGTFVYRDVLATLPGQGAYTWGGNAGATETIWLPINLSFYRYASSADTDVYGLGNVVGNDPLRLLSSALGPGGKAIIYADADNSGSLNSTDTMLEDDGNVRTGPLGLFGNNRIDKRADYVNYLTIKNAGTATGADIPTLYLWSDNLYGNGVCDLGVGPGADDTLLNIMNWNPATNSWDYNNTMPFGVLELNRMCISADFSPFAAPGRTFIPQIPQLTDSVNLGLHDPGEMGWFFYSHNDGPTAGNVTLPYTFTITAFPSYGGGGTTGPTADTNAPGMVTNIVIKADSRGNVIITWQDPSDTDLKQIQIEEKLNDNILADFVAKGVQTKTLSGRIVGKTYTYRLRAQDESGNLGIGQYYDITIPATGEAQAELQALAAPEGPALILQDPVPAGPLPQDVKVGELVRSAKSNSIYFIDQDNRRHTFPNAKVYLSYYPDFDNIQILADNTLAAIPLGSNVTMRPGTWLVKIQSDPKVYAVEPYGVLRWISSEAVAKALYGADWNSRIVDVEATFFINYQTGSAISANVHPTGAVFSYQGETKVYYVDQGKKRAVATDVLLNNKIQNSFIIRNIDKTIVYDDGDALPKLNMEAIMTLK